MHKWQNILPGFLDALEVLSEDFSSHLKAICQIVPALLSMRNRVLLMFFGIFLYVIFLLLNLSTICIWNLLLLHLITIQLLYTLIRNLLYLLQVPAVWCLLLFLFDSKRSNRTLRGTKHRARNSQQSFYEETRIFKVLIFKKLDYQDCN